MAERPPWVPRAVALLVFAVVAAVGVSLHRDYGLPWDEPTHRDYALVVADYVFRGSDQLFSELMRHYGPAHEMLLLAAERVLAARDGPDIWALRHLINILVFAAGCAFLYRLGLAGTGSHLVGLSASAALVLSPRLFADAFYNTKDIPFMVAFVVAVWTLLRLLERPGARTIALHAIASAWLIAIRVPGVLIVALTAACAVYCAIRAGRWPSPRRLFACVGAYLVATAVLTFVLWPTLWRNPVASFWLALQTMGRFPWPFDVLYAGRFVRATDLPWHYAPVWIAISTPLLFLAGLCAGLPAIVRSVVRELTGPSSRRGLYSAIVFVWLVGPLAAAVVMGTVLYDGWRQLFFIYPALLLIAAEGFVSVGRAAHRRWAQRPVRIAAAVALAVLVVAVAGIVRFMVQAHPHQQVFFNALVGGVPGARFRYEMDYWGLSYRRGLEAILRMDDAPLIPVAVADPPGEWYGSILPYGDRQRLVFVDEAEDAKYFVGAYRWRQEEYPFPEIVHREAVDGAPILSVALVNRDRTLTPDSVPAVAALRAENETSLRDVADGDVAAAVRGAVERALSHFVRGADRFELEMEGAVPELRAGRLDRLRVVLEGGEVGDFRRGRDGVPVDRLDVVLGGVLLDVSRLAEGDVRLVQVDRVTVSELVVDGGAVNAALGRSRGEQRRLRVDLDDGLVRVGRAGRPDAEVAIRPWIGPDPWRVHADNLYFEVDALRLAGWRVPVAGLIQLLAGNALSPVIGPEGPDTVLVLGTLHVENQQLRLGTRVAP